MSVRAGREFLMIPGPTTVPDEVLRAMHRPAVDIYSGPLLALTDGLLRDIARVFNTTGRAYIYIANGLRGGAVVDARRPDEKPLSISGMDFRFDPFTREFEAITGAGQFGLMGVVANAAIRGGRHVIGVIPHHLAAVESDPLA